MCQPCALQTAVQRSRNSCETQRNIERDMEMVSGPGSAISDLGRLVIQVYSSAVLAIFPPWDLYKATSTEQRGRETC